MEKVILIIDGVAEGKTKFISFIKENNYWTWNISANNVLGLVSHKLMWDGMRDKNYYEFLELFKSLVNKYFDFERNYIYSMIEKFIDHDRAQVLILHNINQEMNEELTGDATHADKTFTVLITDNDVIDDTYCKTLNYRNETYVEDVLHMMDTLTKSFGKENE